MDMNMIDACVLGLLAVADFAVMVHLRRRHGRVARDRRIMRALEFAVRSEIEPFIH